MNRPSVIVVAHICPFPKNKGNAARLLSLLEWLRSKGFWVVFILQPLDVDSPEFIPQLARIVDEVIVVEENGLLERMRRLMLLPARVGRRVLSALYPSMRLISLDGARSDHTDIDSKCWPATLRAVAAAARRRRPAIVLSEYAFFSQCFAKVPASTLRVIDTVEVFSRNTEQFENSGVAANLVSTRESESVALSRADLVLAIQSDDAEFLRNLVPTKRVITVGHVFSEARPRATSPRRGIVLFVGSANEYNRHGLEMFLANAWARIRNACPEAVLEIVGEARPSAPVTFAEVRFLGRVADEKLVELYQTAHVVINPQVIGTGLKIKCVEALSAGCPLVVNQAGADGLRDGAGTAFLIANNWDEFAEHVVRLIQNDAARLELESQARRFAADKFSRSRVFGELDKCVDDELAERLKG